MPLAGIIQPEILAVSEDLRLRKYDGRHDFALPWYRDAETLRLIGGNTVPYDAEKVARMYRYLDGKGELYFIEIRDGDGFRPIGDVTWWKDDMPIVIGDASCRGRGIGRRVIGALVNRARSLGFTSLGVDEIYHFNAASRRMFEACGFTKSSESDKGISLRLTLLPIEFRPISAFPRGTLYSLLADAYAFDARCAAHWENDWRAFDDFFSENPSIADKSGFVTVLAGNPIGFVSWDPRALPARAVIGHNCIAAAYKGRGYGRAQLREAVCRLAEAGAKRLTVTTNSLLFPASAMYEGVGFTETNRRENVGDDAFAGEYIDYELHITKG
ncbi:MAG: GNAT family N-acetyltransferase [Clostridia bacterium]|nr:GNAT family N-acetyltransferase [Clostridia bacterium]